MGWRRTTKRFLIIIFYSRVSVQQTIRACTTPRTHEKKKTRKKKRDDNVYARRDERINKTVDPRLTCTNNAPLRRIRAAADDDDDEERRWSPPVRTMCARVRVRAPDWKGQGGKSAPCAYAIIVIM